MIAGNDVQLEYEDGKQWYWLVSLSHARKPDEAPKPPKPANVTLAAPRTQRRKVLDLSSETSSEIKVGNDPILARAFSNNSPSSTSSKGEEKVEEQKEGEAYDRFKNATAMELSSSCLFSGHESD